MDSAMLKKILAARKLQKDQVESSHREQQGFATYQEEQAKPLITALNTQTDTIKKSIHDEVRVPVQLGQKMLSNQATIYKQQQQQQKALQQQPQQPQAQQQQPQELTWVQKLFNSVFGASKPPRYDFTQWDVNPTNGILGLNGRVDINALFQKGHVRVSLTSGELVYDNENPSRGLVSLLLLPGPYLRDQRNAGDTTVTDEDTKTFHHIMTQVGATSTNSLKLTEFINKLSKKKKKNADLNATVLEDDSPPKKKSSKSGRGVFAYSDANDLKKRLELIAGSIRAGNTSSELRDGMRAILDELFHLKLILPSVHRRFYKQFLL